MSTVSLIVSTNLWHSQTHLLTILLSRCFLCELVILFFPYHSLTLYSRLVTATLLQQQPLVGSSAFSILLLASLFSLSSCPRWVCICICIFSCVLIVAFVFVSVFVTPSYFISKVFVFVGICPYSLMIGSLFPICPLSLPLSVFLSSPSHC